MKTDGIEYIPFAGRSALLEVDHDDKTIIWWTCKTRMDGCTEERLKAELLKMIFQEGKYRREGYRLIGDSLRQFQADAESPPEV